jgi:hypothetical protein
MTQWRWIGILSIALWGALWIAPGNLAAASGYTIEDIKLKSAADLLNVCTVEPTHEHYQAATAFCYGFFEGAIRYHQAIAGPEPRKKLVCAPEGTTRLQAVDVFVSYLRANPQYATESAIDAIIRALMARWPCAE